MSKKDFSAEKKIATKPEKIPPVKKELKKTAKNVAQKINTTLTNSMTAIARRSSEDKPIQKKSNEPKSPYGMMRVLLLERKFTDDEILKKVVEKFGTGSYMTKKNAVSLVRSDINKGVIKTELKEELKRIVVDENGKRSFVSSMRSTENETKKNTSKASEK